MDARTIVLRWPTGGAQLNLAGWFPASKTKLAHLHKLLSLDPVAAQPAVTACLDYIRETEAVRKQSGQDNYRQYLELRQIIADAADQLSTGTQPNGYPLSQADRVTLREACTRAKTRANRAAAAARRAERDIKHLRQNAAAIKAWGF